MIEVCGTARNGEDALKRIVQCKPNVVTLDVEMPVKNGLETLKGIMKDTPLPVIMLSSLTKAGTSQTIEAMQHGAIDFISKPSGQISLDLHKVQAELIDKIKHAARARVRNDPIIIDDYTKQLSYIEDNLIVKHLLVEKDKIVAIGTSTGGPRALVEVLAQLRGDLDAPVVIVQHMPPVFTKSLAERLNRISPIEVKEAEDGDILVRGKAYIAPGGFHMFVEKVGADLKVRLDNHLPPERGHRPSVDYLFQSLSELREYQTIAVVMTGMGSDGTQGVIALKTNTDSVVIAESEESSIVFGMPRSVIESNKVDEICHLNEIAHIIRSYTN